MKMKLKNSFICILLLFIFYKSSISRVLEVGNGKTYSNIRNAANQAIAGDTIFVYSGLYSGGMAIANLQGTAKDYIYIIGEENQEVIIKGGSNSIQFSDAKYLKIQNLIFEEQTGNGLNIDDAGSIDTPTEFITITNCTFRNMAASGNNDQLKLSGLDNFIIENCRFENGAAGGSGIDMVGCHKGIIRNNYFTNLGSNAIQAKGGTQYIEMSANYFENCGQRTLNLGGSTGLEFFRPIDAKFEAADLQVYSNVFIGSVAPIAYVGSVRVDVINNTIINPERWVMRILQETVDENRFEKCGNNRFENNIIYFGNISTEANVGSNTAPETFTIKNNFWYNHQNPNWQRPTLPVTEENQIVKINPEFVDFSNRNFNLQENSKAKHYINYEDKPQFDFTGNKYESPRSAGAFEVIKSNSIGDNSGGNNSENQNSSKTTKQTLNQIEFYPNPTTDYLVIKINSKNQTFPQIEILDYFGNIIEIFKIDYSQSQQIINLHHLKSGVYLLKYQSTTHKFIKL